MAAATDEIEPSAKRVKVDTETQPEKPETTPETTEAAVTETAPETVEDKKTATKDTAESKGEDDQEDAEEKEEAAEKSGVVLICGSMNWDLIGREKARVNAKPRKVEPAWSPQVVSALSGVRVTQIITGNQAAHSFFITDQAKLYGLGRNECGQLGTGTTKRLDRASIIPFFKNKQVISAACGRNHSIVITLGQGSFAMGENVMGQLGIGGDSGKGKNIVNPRPVALKEQLKMAAGGHDFSLFLTQEGFLYSAGSSESGQLGTNDTGEYIDNRKTLFSAHATPSRIHSFFTLDQKTKTKVRIPQVLIRHISCGMHHSAAISTADHLFTWGFNGHGRLGHKTTENELIPMRVNHFRVSDKNQCVRIAKCSVGGVFAVNNIGTVYVWGMNNIARLECPYPIPIEDMYGWDVHDIAPGKQHHVIVADKSSISMGKQTKGELGMGPNTKSSSQLDKMNSVDGIPMLKCAAGIGHTLLLADDSSEEAKRLIEGLDVNED